PEGGLGRLPRRRQHDGLAECRRFRHGAGPGLAADGLDEPPGLVVPGVAHSEEDVVALLRPAAAQRAADVPRPDDCDSHGSFPLLEGCVSRTIPTPAGRSWSAPFRAGPSSFPLRGFLPWGWYDRTHPGNKYEVRSAVRTGK